MLELLNIKFGAAIPIPIPSLALADTPPQRGCEHE
jgi:hypothetical protein